MNSGAKKKYVWPENGWFGSARPPTTVVDAAISRPSSSAPAVAHEDPRRVEVVGQEPEADAEHDDRDQRADVRLGQQAELVEALAVEEERARRDGDDAGGQPVEPVDEVDGVGHADQPQDGDERGEVLADR